ncbi:MAG: hypothetical protein LIO77_00910 [Rikenellaceae bacterium]|nr:hypothetical protein [Rikenellaceae bacterium]
MKYLWPILLLAAAACLIVFFIRNRKDGKAYPVSTPQRIKIGELPVVIDQLQNKRTEFDFIGITSNGIDCIYVVRGDGCFHIEYEAIDRDQLEYIEKIKDFCEDNGYPVVLTTYGNKPDYPCGGPAPVIRIEKEMTAHRIVSLCEKIQSEIFGNNPATVYDVVP